MNLPPDRGQRRERDEEEIRGTSLAGPVGGATIHSADHYSGINICLHTHLNPAMLKT